MKSISRLEEWSLKYLEHGKDGETKLASTNTTTTTISPSTRRAITKSVRNPLFGSD